DQQNCFVSALHLFSRNDFVGYIGRFPCLREKDLKGRSNAEFAHHVHPALVLLDDAINRGQPETSSLSDLFGRKERLKNSSQRFLAHSSAGIGDTQAHKPASPRFRML